MPCHRRESWRIASGGQDLLEVFGAQVSAREAAGDGGDLID
jgi:hypothetical protein